MNKKMRELMAQINEQKDLLKGYMVEGEGRDLVKAEDTLNKIDDLQKEFDLEKRTADMEKSVVPAAEVKETGKADGFKMIAKMMHKKALSCLLYTSPSPRDRSVSRMPSSA